MDSLLKKRVRQILVSDYGALFSKEVPQEGKLRDIATNILNNLVQRERITIANEERSTLINEIIDEFLGYGPIQGLLNDPAVTEIMINGPKKVYAEKKGRMQLTDVTFENEQQLMYMVYKIIAPTRRRVDESYPYAEVSISDGSRVNIIIPPLALNGTTVTIRKFSKDINTADDLIKLGSLDKRMSDFLIAAVKAKVNIVFSGATGAGKTTALNAFSSYIPEDERIVTIEDIAELRLQQEHLVRLEARQASIEGRGEVTIRDLFKNSLRMRPDRIIIGEIRGAEALEMLQAICSGHKGSMAVLHAESPQDVIYRIETMILTSGLPITLAAIQRQIAAAINLIVQQEQLVDGSRKITHITQVNGLKNDAVVLEDLFVYNIESVDPQGKVRGHWKATGIQPCFAQMFHKAGVNLPKLG